jgi:hypothetical protein
LVIVTASPSCNQPESCAKLLRRSATVAVFMVIEYLSWKLDVKAAKDPSLSVEIFGRAVCLTSKCGWPDTCLEVTR